MAGSRYTNGSEPYGLSKKDKALYEQPFLARKLLEKVLLSGHNQKILSKVGIWACCDIQI